MPHPSRQAVRVFSNTQPGISRAAIKAPISYSPQARAGHTEHVSSIFSGMMKC
jgi:hypothetical protein